MENGIVKRWENFRNNANRKYKIKYLAATLKGAENEEGGKEIIEKKEEEPKKKNSPNKKALPNQKLNSSDFFLDGKDLFLFKFERKLFNYSKL
jgi:(p)ppGpp synthase/HD superfamily hydrolase